ncbi:multidrug efflux MFS transporter [Acetilactobacillus jinshanensis]|uniref:multidrug efflux MFS transporter n=1 Tax=Acetilactobacillus jinshanensis TaxID=1720083 RepID=UPI0013A646D1|nr:multidrug efflux MFS transporter [Acetilactobacillus jinshanensis]URL61440.1 multidrug efflux MFS transporter [uncultured bacterium]
MAFSLNMGAQAMGSSMVALLGGFITNLFNYNGAFYFAGIILLVNYVLLKWRVLELNND